MSHRFFVADESTYENVRRQLDAAWGHPTPDGKTVTCVDPAAVAPRNRDGGVMLAVKSEFCEYDASAGMLAQLLAIGSVEEITESEYMAALPQPTT